MQGQLKLSPEEFWTAPYRTRDDFESPLLRKEQEGFVVDAPAEVPIDARETAPVVVLRVSTMANAIRLPFRTAAVLTVVDVGENTTYADVAVATPVDRGGAPPKEAPTGPLPTGMQGEAFTLDLRKRLGIPWRPSRLLVTLLLRDQPTDRLSVRLVESPAKFQDSEVKKFREAERKKPAVPALSPAPGTPFTSYATGADSLAIPQETTLSLAAPRVVLQGGGEPVLLRGSFRLPVLERHVVPADGKGAEALLDQLTRGEKRPTAVVPITIVATGSEEPTPFVWRLVVPTYEPVERRGDALFATGRFAVDLQSLADVKGVEQTLFLYTFSSDVMVGPLPIAFTSH